MLFLKECVASDISPEITDCLFSVLEDDSSEEPPSSTCDAAAITPDDHKQDQAVRCLVKIIHLIQHANLDSRHQVHVCTVNNVLDLYLLIIINNAWFQKIIHTHPHTHRNSKG